MIFMRDIAQAYYQNGYCPIPANCKDKLPLIEWKAHQSNYDFDKAWEKWLDCDIAIILNGVVCVDFDKHGTGPYGRDYYDMLQKEYPQLFKGAVLEQSQSDGIHAYYRWTPDLPDHEWKLPVVVDGQQVFIEIKTGNKRLAYCSPSKKNNRPAYILLTDGFDKILLKKLSPLPSIFRYFPEIKPVKSIRHDYKNTEITDEMRAQALDIIVECYKRNASIESKMNISACAMTAYMKGLGYHDNDIERALKSYERYGHRNFKTKEIDDILRYITPDRKAIYPFRKVRQILK